MSKTKLTLLTALLLLMVVSLTVLVPSGAVTDEALSRYEDALWEEDEETDESARNLLKPRAVLANAALSDILPAVNINALDTGLFTPGSAPLEENFTENSYRDDSIIVEMEKKRLYDSDVFIAYVRIATPTGQVLTQGGTFHFENRQLEFSIRKDIEYTGEEQKVQVWWDVAETLSAGTYRVDIFADGHNIGGTTLAFEK